MNRTIYFGYGSNLWLDQMQRRCSNSKYLGIGRLKGWRLQINGRGFCNVVEKDSEAGDYTWEVYGLVYSLSDADEEKLDTNEGVPVAYTKEIINLQFWAGRHSDGYADINTAPEDVDMLVYVDRKRTEDSEPRTEYIYRMNQGIKDAVRMGIPEDYVSAVLRRYIPKDEDSVLTEKDRVEAEQQATKFQDPCVY